MKLIKIFGACLLIAVFTSCEDLLDDEPVSTITTDNFYKTQDDALAAIFACYEYLGGGSFNETYGGAYFTNYWIMASDASDEGQHSGIDVSLMRISNFTEDSHPFPIYQVWRDFYRTIGVCNVAVDKIPTIEMDTILRTQLVAEARFIRGLCYFELVRMFGDVPLTLHLPATIDEADNVVRTPKAEVYNQIISDLNFGKKMPESRSGEYAGRATSYSASAVLGKVYLTQGQYQKSLAELNRIINSGKYGLWDDFADVFKIENNNGKESVFSINFSHGEKFYEGGHQVLRLLPSNIGMNTFGTERPTDALYNSFAEGDRRKEVTFITSFTKSDGTELTFLPYVQKYWDREAEPYASATYNDLQIYRYAGILLMQSEAYNELGNDSCYVGINAVRKRAEHQADGTYSDVLPALSGLSQENMREAILNERMRELCFEGQRWFDLVRMGKLVEKVKSAKPDANVQEFHDLYPIPYQTIITATTDIKQNPGYN